MDINDDETKNLDSCALRGYIFVYKCTSLHSLIIYLGPKLPDIRFHFLDDAFLLLLDESETAVTTTATGSSQEIIVIDSDEGEGKIDYKRTKRRTFIYKYITSKSTRI